MNIVILSCDYHRNGISGEGFESVRFTWTDDLGKTRNMLASMFTNGSGYCAVHDLDDLDACWRGDVFEHELKKALSKRSGAA